MNSKYKNEKLAIKILTPTFADIEGPYYKAGAPFKTELDPKATLKIHGKVFNIYRKEIDAVLDFWQADKDGNYDMVGFNYRGKVKTIGESGGLYEINTIVPGDYQISPTEFRCAHIHVKVSSPGYKLLTTQLYFEDDKYNDTDEWYNPQNVIGRIDGVFNFVLEKDNKQKELEELRKRLNEVDHSISWLRVYEIELLKIKQELDPQEPFEPGV
jgi:protocatechuate 3,4-dioxygenase beta subunit